MIISVNLTPEELKALSKTSTLTGLSIDEVIHNAIIKAINEQMSGEKGTPKREEGKTSRVYKKGVDPYAPIFEESDWEMFSDTRETI